MRRLALAACLIALPAAVACGGGNDTADARKAAAGYVASLGKRDGAGACARMTKRLQRQFLAAVTRVDRRFSGQPCARAMSAALRTIPPDQLNRFSQAKIDDLKVKGDGGSFRYTLGQIKVLGRSERDRDQFVSTENSMGVVQMSRGTLEPASAHLLSEPQIVARLARAVLGSRTTVDWEAMAADYDLIRDAIERTIPGFERYNARVREPGGFLLPNAARERRFVTATGRANFTAHPLPRLTLAAGELIRLGAGTFVEVGPGNGLSGLVKRIDRNVNTISVGRPADLDRLEETLASD